MVSVPGIAVVVRGFPVGSNIIDISGTRLDTPSAFPAWNVIEARSTSPTWPSMLAAATRTLLGEPPNAGLQAPATVPRIEHSVAVRREGSYMTSIE